MAPCPNMSAEDWNFLKLLKTKIVEDLLFIILSGSPLQFEVGQEMTELRPLTHEQGAKMRAVRKNDPNLPVTLPNLNIFQYD